MFSNPDYWSAFQEMITMFAKEETKCTGEIVSYRIFADDDPITGCLAEIISRRIGDGADGEQIFLNMWGSDFRPYSADIEVCYEDGSKQIINSVKLGEDYFDE